MEYGLKKGVMNIMCAGNGTGKSYITKYNHFLYYTGMHDLLLVVSNKHCVNAFKSFK